MQYHCHCEQVAHFSLVTIRGNPKDLAAEPLP